MGRVQTNETGLAYAKEQTLGVLPGSPEWNTLEPNDISQFGATITTVARSPISRYRQRRKGTVVDLDSAVTFEADITMEHLRDFIPAWCFSKLVGPAVFSPTAVVASTDSYTVASGGALAAGLLVKAQGFINAANNGLKLVDTGSDATNIIVADDLVDESAPSNAQLSVCGVQGAAGDIEINADGNLISTALDFSTLGLTVGQALWIGGASAATQFATAGNSGFVRIRAIADHLITLDKRGQAFTADDGATKTIQLFFGQFVRNVPVGHPDYEITSFAIEAAYPNLGNPSGDRYEYAMGNYVNILTLNLPLTDKGTMSVEFVGTDTPVPTNSRATNAATARSPLRVGAFNTSADFLRLRVQNVNGTDITSYFKELTLTLNNNVAPEKVLANLGAVYMNAGNFEVDLSGQALFTNEDMVAAIRENRTLTGDFALRNEDGGIMFDLPALTFGDGSKEFTRDESVKINITGESFGDPTLNTSVGITFFPHLPV